MCVEQDTGQKAWLPVGCSRRSIDAVARKQRLHLVPKSLVDKGFMLAGIVLVLVHRRFADSLVGQRLVDADEPAGDRSTLSPLKGPEPEIVGGRGSEAEREALRSWVKELLDGGFAPDEIAIFARTKSLIERQ